MSTLEFFWHVVASLFWRLVLVTVTPLAYLGFPSPAIWSAWWLIYHDDRTAVR